MSDTVERRRLLAKKAWKESFARLFAKAGPDWPVGSTLHTHEIDTAESEANRQTELYVQGDKRANAKEALKVWEDLMGIAIEAAKGKRGCSQCGVEKVAEVVMDNGSRACGRCRSGVQDANPIALEVQTTRNNSRALARTEVADVPPSDGRNG